MSYHYYTSKRLRETLERVRDFMHSALTGTAHQENLDHYEAEIAKVISAPKLSPFRLADERYRHGEGISDEDLSILIIHYRAAAKALDDCWNPEYNLVANDIHNRLQELEGFQLARKRKD